MLETAVRRKRVLIEKPALYKLSVDFPNVRVAVLLKEYLYEVHMVAWGAKTEPCCSRVDQRAITHTRAFLVSKTSESCRALKVAGGSHMRVTCIVFWLGSSGSMRLALGFVRCFHTTGVVDVSPHRALVRVKVFTLYPTSRALVREKQNHGSSTPRSFRFCDHAAVILFFSN